MSAPIKVTDLVSKSLESLSNADTATDPTVVARQERRATIYADLASAQSAKTANIIAYLNSDREKWSETDESVVRTMLGLPSPEGDGGGEETFEVEPEPFEPEPATEPEPTAAANAEQEADLLPEVQVNYDEEPTFA